MVRRPCEELANRACSRGRQKHTRITTPVSQEEAPPHFKRCLQWVFYEALKSPMRGACSLQAVLARCTAASQLHFPSLGRPGEELASHACSTGRQKHNSHIAADIYVWLYPGGGDSLSVAREPSSARCAREPARLSRPRAHMDLRGSSTVLRPKI